MQICCLVITYKQKGKVKQQTTGNIFENVEFFFFFWSKLKLQQSFCWYKIIWDKNQVFTLFSRIENVISVSSRPFYEYGVLFFPLLKFLVHVFPRSLLRNIFLWSKYYKKKQQYIFNNMQSCVSRRFLLKKSYGWKKNIYLKIVDKHINDYYSY